jgi:hypothetical protein
MVDKLALVKDIDGNMHMCHARLITEYEANRVEEAFKKLQNKVKRLEREIKKLKGKK